MRWKVIRELRQAGRLGELVSLLESGEVKPEQLSIAGLFKALVDDGEERFEAMTSRKSGGRSLFEAAGQVDTSAFTQISGQILEIKVKQGYDDPTLIHPQLCETINTNRIHGTKLFGAGGPGDLFGAVDEGENYPTVGLNEEYIETAITAKRGAIIPITRELIIADATGEALRQAGRLGFYMGVNKEKRCLDTFLTNTYPTYKRNGTTTNNYLTSGAYINDQTGNALATGSEWRAIESAMLLQQAITDPNTAEPIMLAANTVIVPLALRMSAMRILGATGVQHVDNQANAATIRTSGNNPLTTTLNVLSNQYVGLRTSSNTKWFLGDPRRAFAYMEVWGIETTQAARGSEAEYTADIEYRFKVSERGVAQTIEPRYMIRNDN